MISTYIDFSEGYTDGSYMGIVDASSLNVREGAGTSYGVLTSLSRNEKVNYMRYKYYFCDRDNPLLRAFLNDYNIHYKVQGEDTFLPLISFHLWSTTVNLETLLKALEDMNIRPPVIWAEYSASEVNNAKFLWITPVKQVINIMNHHEAYKHSCEWTTYLGVPKTAHNEQQALFVIDKEPSMKTKTAFWAEATGFAELFTDWRVHQLVEEHSLSGIEFNNVIHKNGKYSEKMYQLTTQNILKKHCIGVGYGEKKKYCDMCGREQYIIDNTYQLHLDFSKIETDSDFYVTERIFGGGIDYPLYVISQRFYQLLKQNNLAGGITVSPVAEIHK